MALALLRLVEIVAAAVEEEPSILSHVEQSRGAGIARRCGGNQERRDRQSAVVVEPR